MATKAPPKPAKPAPYDTESLLRLTADKLRSILESIELYGDDEQEPGAGQHDATVKNVARVSVALTTVCAELRQNAKALVREVAEIPLDQIMTYLRGLSQSTRDELARELTGEDAEESIL